MIVQCVSFGGHWYLHKVFDPETNALIRRKSRFMNTSAIGNKYEHKIKGFVRVNAAARPYFDDPKDLLQAKYVTEGVTRYRETNRLILSSRAANDAQVDRFLVCIRSSKEGLIRFDSEWRVGGKARIVSSSFFRNKQETLLLMEPNAMIRTTLATWRIMCKNQTSFLGLADVQ